MLKTEWNEYRGLPGVFDFYYEVKSADSSKGYPSKEWEKTTNLTVQYDVYSNLEKTSILDDLRDSHTFNVLNTELVNSTDVYELAYIKLKELEKFKDAIDC